MTGTGQQWAAPEHLSDEMRVFWDATVAAYVFDESEVRVLEAACEHWDAARALRCALARDGVVTDDRYGNSRVHPALPEMRSSLAAFTRALKDLGITGVTSPPLPIPGRPI